MSNLTGGAIEICTSNAQTFPYAVSNDLLIYHNQSNANVSIGVAGSTNAIKVSSNATYATGPLYAT